MSFAEVKNVNGEPSIVIDGTPYPPMAMTTRIIKRDYLRNLGSAGLRIFFLMANTRWLCPGRTWIDAQGTQHTEPNGFEAFSTDVAMLLEEVPDAYIIVRIGMHPPVEWMEAHPEELMTYNDGTHKRAILQSEVHCDTIPGMYSLCSEKWRKDGAVALQEFCDEVDAQPYADRIIGYFLAAGGTSEWYPVNPVTDYKEKKYADFSPAFIAEYSNILKEKYKTEDVLGQAWNKPDAVFTNPIIPDITSRRHVHIDDTIYDALLNFENADREIGKKLDLNPISDYNLGVFLNANQHNYVADFFYAWHRGTANTIIHFAQVLKNKYKGKLVGAFYGSYGCTDFYNASTAGATLAIMDSGVVDFLAAPGVYNNREPGGYVAQREMQDSFRIRNQMFVVEEDSRTHLENDFYRDAMGLYDVQDSIDTLKRDYARNICEDIFAWWFDQHPEGGRYQHKDIYQLFQRQSEISQLAYSLPRKKHNEIALIYDQESIFYVSSMTSQIMLDFYRTSDLGRIGAPVDYYFHDDMARADMPNYKMYLMLNIFCATDAEREAIHRKAAQNNAVVVWLYAPGFINTDKTLKMDNAYITQLTGFACGRIDETTSPRFTLSKKHPATRLGALDRKYGYIDRDVHSNVWLSQIIPPPYANPLFYVDDPDAEELGRYLINQKTAYALKEYKGFTSVWCCAHILRAELLASLAEYAGCHLYTYSDDLIYANENFVTIHAQHSGPRTLHFKTECSPFELYEKKYYGHNTTKIELYMRKGETLMFQVRKAQK